MRRSKGRGNPHPPQHTDPLTVITGGGVREQAEEYRRHMTVDGQPVVLGKLLMFPDPPVPGPSNGVYVVSEGSPYRDGFRMWPEDVMFYVGLVIAAIGVAFLLVYAVVCFVIWFASHAI